MKILAAFIDTILPPRCIFSGDLVDSPGTVSSKAWSALEFISSPYCSVCGFPFEFEVGKGEEALCAACLKERPPYDRARAALRYDDASRDFILGFKHGDKTHAVVTMAPWLKMAGAEFWEQTDFIIPVPLHRWRLLRRRYNQAALMAQQMAKVMGKAALPGALVRTRATPTQGHLNSSQRAENVKKAFAVNPKIVPRIAGKNVVLIDDVYTTGATIRECTKALRKAGVEKVFVLTLAKVVRPERFD